MNSINPHLQFTCETEVESKLPFLDLLIINESNKIKLDLYKKPTSSNRLLNYHSNHPYHQKLNLITQARNKIYNLSDSNFWQKNLNDLNTNLYQNGYPRSLINRILNEKPKPPSPKNTPNIIRYFKIPYIKNLSEELAKKLRNDNSAIAFYNTKNVGNLFSKVKDKEKNELKSNIVYQIPCCNCDSSYIGQTKQYLKNRMADHKRDCNIIHVNNPKTGLAKHHFNEGHNFDFKNVKVLDQSANLQKRLFLEMSHIQKCKPNVNLNQDVQDLSIIYKNIINNFS